ncbi:WD40 repeat domain-containing protein [Lignipirellula cremea]|uniref:WD domain, G-beta repeat n=1 Tax=Lignipirellula cremea TaxID=2528010 RepID=A0A518DZ48_9BACT|nr:hypothetical protein [Lignipirellula cremea]QDU97119.1 hypothetical protein Pla8534_49640 [Lignipirellula cremea]
MADLVSTNASRFAYGPASRRLISAEGREVVVSNTENEHWAATTDSLIAGVANTNDGVLVLEQDGVLRRYASRSGELIDRVECGFSCRGLRATPEGRWVAWGANRLILGHGVEVLKRERLPGIRCAAVSSSGRFAVAAVGREEMIVVFADAEQRKSCLLPDEPVEHLAWSVDGWWLVTTPSALVGYSLELSADETITRFASNLGRISGGVVSPTGRILACKIRENTVCLFGLKEGVLGTVQYPERAVSEIEFGPHPYLGIGIDRCSGNKINLTEKAVVATKHPAGPTGNGWFVNTHLKYDLLQREAQRKEPFHIEEDELNWPLVIGCSVLVLLAVAATCGSLVWFLF